MYQDSLNTTPHSSTQSNTQQTFNFTNPNSPYPDPDDIPFTKGISSPPQTPNYFITNAQHFSLQIITNHITILFKTLLITNQSIPTLQEFSTLITPLINSNSPPLTNQPNIPSNQNLNITSYILIQYNKQIKSLSNKFINKNSKTLLYFTNNKINNIAQLQLSNQYLPTQYRT